MKRSKGTFWQRLTYENLKGVCFLYGRFHPSEVMCSTERENVSFPWLGESCPIVRDEGWFGRGRPTFGVMAHGHPVMAAGCCKEEDDGVFLGYWA